MSHEPRSASLKALAQNSHSLQKLLLCLSHIEMLAHICRDGLQGVKVYDLVASCKTVDAAGGSIDGISVMCHMRFWDVVICRSL